MSVDDRIAKIDAYRARRIGEMLITADADEQFLCEPDVALVDLEQLTGAELLSQFARRNAQYATAPFDAQGQIIRFYPGGVTIWSGYPGGGKTTLLRQFVCHTLHRGSSVFLASLEEDPTAVLVRLAATAAGRDTPTRHQMQWFIDAYKARFRLWGRVGITQHLPLLAVVRQCATQASIKHAVIDSLMCLDVRNDDFEAQRKFANLLAATARALQIHIHLVAHPRKLVSSDQELDLNDVAGAREIGGIADNVIFLRRVKGPEHYGQGAESTPMCISVKKQRHFNGQLGDCGGWFHRKLRQFHGEQFVDAPARYLPDDAFDPSAA